MLSVMAGNFGSSGMGSGVKDRLYHSSTPVGRISKRLHNALKRLLQQAATLSDRVAGRKWRVESGMQRMRGG
ncbi:hypothetical protein C4K68_08490 [Pokkaliibacter plantistimulans]|uniref:Uncharacterized protein n=1 Tax=Proteobacteria bacterium 228 TaxID=2083153 RepID=A0A2S5KSX2_9PROT|nr:hypothetical protein [Pokkaliibacter plantistimulans]PPC77813.1 hypothetical protein C4K68_08490 [Pokkaliibacter plantistimulans]